MKKRIKNLLAALVTPLPLFIAVPPSAAQDIRLEGQWHYSRVNNAGEHYSGSIMIDTRGQASNQTRRPPTENGSIVIQRGYVKVSGSDIDIIFNSVDKSDYSPDHFHCMAQSDRELSCSNVDAAGHQTNKFTVLRIGE